MIVRKPSKRTKVKVKRVSSHSSLKTKADKAVREYCRALYLQDGGYYICFTCGAIKTLEHITIGHFRKRGNMALRYNLDNIRMQCVKCNNFLQGNDIIFERNLRKELGNQKVDLLMVTNSHKITNWELEMIITDFENKLKELQ